MSGEAELEGILERVARKCAGYFAEDAAIVLKRELLPLLKAGARARLVCVNREVAQEYDATLEAALAGEK
jgi:hypothetical protein